MRKDIVKLLTSISLTVIFLFTLGSSRVSGAPVSGNDITYTLDADFDRGTQMNLEHETVHDQLQLSDVITPFPFINIANSGRGTIVRIDVNTGTILGEYYTSPSGLKRNPSRTTVDQFGNVWVSNRDEAGSSGGKSKGSITRIGLIIGGTRANANGSENPTGQYLKPPFQYNTCIDRNNDGLIKTSRAANNMLAWTNTGGADTHGGVSTADDECIINYTRVVATHTRTVAIDANNDIWVGGDNKAHEKVNGVTGQPVPGTQFNLGCGGYGGLIDKNGVLWSARYGTGLLRYDTKTMTGACLGTGKGDYGLGMDPNTGEIWHTFYSTGYVAKLAPDGTLLGKYYHGASYAQGVVVDKSGNVWVAHSTRGSNVGHLRTNGTLVGKITTGSGPTGVSVDANGKVWSTNYNAWTASRINPNAGATGGGGFKIGAVDKTVSLGSSAYPYNYSDMTGYVAIGGTSSQGSWSVVQDSGVAGKEWGTITWNSEPQGVMPAGSIILVEARTADSETALGSKSFTAVSSNQPFSLFGRYIEVRVTLKPNSSGEKPVLSDLRISVTPISDVRVIDTISSGNVIVNTNSFTEQPYSVSYGSDTTTIEWRFNSFTIGQLRDLSYSVTMKDPVPGENRLVDHKLEVLYTDINGNPVRYETGPQYVQVLSSKYASTLTTDKRSYSAKENVVIAAAITNLSQFARTVDARITIEDSAGATVQEVASLFGLQFLADETKNFNDLVFNTGANAAGDYRARLSLYEGQNLVGNVTADFKIVPDISVTSGITTDKVSYKTNEQVAITSVVQSVSANSMIEDLTARVSVKDSQGTVLMTDSKPIALLTPGQRISFNSYWNTGINPAGAYSANLEVFSGETVLSASSAQFEILATAVTGGGFTGTITASPDWIYQGKTETFAIAVTNEGNEDVAGLTATILVVDPDMEQTKMTFTKEGISLAQGATVTDARAASMNLPAKVYLAILQVQSASMSEPKTLASAAFEVKRGMEISKNIPDQKRVLVWLNYPWQSGQNCPDRALIEQALTNAGLLYYIVLDKDEFEQEFRNDFYTDIMILGDFNPIEDHFAEELREQVNAGKGLVSSLFNRQNIDYPVFDLKFTGSLPASLQGRTVVFAGTEFVPSGSFSAAGTVLKVESPDETEVVAWVPEETSKGTVNYPAVIRRAYGKGRAIFFAFDLGMSAAPDAAYEDLIRNSAAYVHRPVETSALRPGQYVPVELTIKSLGAAFDLRLTESYPEGLKIFDPASGLPVENNPWVKEIQLGAEETKTVLYYIIAPDAEGVYSLSTQVEYLEAGSYVTYGELATDFTVQCSTESEWSDSMSALLALSLSGGEAAARDNVVRYLASVGARQVQSQKDRETVIDDLRKAATGLLVIASCDITGIRDSLDVLLLFREADWYIHRSP